MSVTTMELEEHFNTNDCNFDEHLKMHILKKYPETTDFLAFKTHEDNYMWKLLTSLPDGINSVMGEFYRIYTKLFD